MTAASLDSGFLKLIFGRHLALSGDAESVAAGTNGYALLGGETGGVMATTRAMIVKCQVASNGAGQVTLAGVLIGDTVLSVVNISTAGDVTSSFESTISVNGQIRQTAATNLSAAQCIFSVRPMS